MDLLDRSNQQQGPDNQWMLVPSPISYRTPRYHVTALPDAMLLCSQIPCYHI